MKISTDLWFEKALAKAESVVQDPEDRKLLNPETYDLIHAIDYPHMGASGIFGDYVEVEAFQKLADRFLLACELIKTMESNSPETPDSSPHDCDTCRYWGGWSKNCGFCHNSSKWEGRSTLAHAAPEPRSAEESERSCATCDPKANCYGCTGYANWKCASKADPAPAAPSEDWREIAKQNAITADQWKRDADALRSQLARKDEGIEADDGTCKGCERDGEQDKWKDCIECSRNVPDNYEAALREPDGRKGE